MGSAMVKVMEPVPVLDAKLDAVSAQVNALGLALVPELELDVASDAEKEREIDWLPSVQVMVQQQVY